MIKSRICAVKEELPAQLHAGRYLCRTGMEKLRRAIVALYGSIMKACKNGLTVICWLIILSGVANGAADQAGLPPKNSGVESGQDMPSYLTGYEKLKEQFTAEKFDADFITDLAIDAGMKYDWVAKKFPDRPRSIAVARNACEKNTGPLPDGSIYPADVETLRAVGKMKLTIAKESASRDFSVKDSDMAQ